jgi:hypothetical protein
MEQRDEFIVQVLSTIDEAEVVTIFFPNLAKALVVDARISLEEKPLIKVVNQVNSMEERMASIEKMRPALGRIRSIAGIPWTKSIRSIGENDIMDRIEQRLTSAGLDIFAAQAACAEAFTKLKEIERTQWVDLIKGTSPFYKTIWEDASHLS